MKNEKTMVKKITLIVLGIFSLLMFVLGVAIFFSFIFEDKQFGPAFLSIIMFVLPFGLLLKFCYKNIIKIKSREKILIYTTNIDKISIEDLSRKTKIKPDKLKDNIYEMIANRLIDGQINEEKNCLISSDYEEELEEKEIRTRITKCKECGAKNKIVAGVVQECEYCGTVLRV